MILFKLSQYRQKSYPTQSNTIKRVKLMEHQLCTTIDIGSPLKSNPRQAVVRNRRFKKLQQLRASGFFSQEAIKLRHPLLYHTYLGTNTQHSRPAPTNDCTLSDFLSKNLMNLEYRERLEQELSGTMEYQLEEMSLEEPQAMQEEKEQARTEGDFEERWEPVEQEEIELEQQNLIDHAEQLFLQGKIDPTHIDYAQIDFNSDYDDREEAGRDEQEEYFREEGEENERDRATNTGIQDY